MTIRILTSDHPAFPPGWPTRVGFEGGRLATIGYHRVSDVDLVDGVIVIKTIQCYRFEVAPPDYTRLLNSAPAGLIEAWRYTDQGRKVRYYGAGW